MKMRTLLLVASAFAAPLAFTAAPAHADGGVYVGVEGENIAVGGYDTVSYFEGDGVPVKGDARFTVEHDGAEWRFASQENADAFKADPDAYAPQYGGHCAWALGANGRLAPGDPTVYKIVDGKLYLNFNKQVQQMWLKDIAGFIAKANLAWTAIPSGQRFG
ncbi:MAG: YHS domain-containing (seleno)protein [Erythrobacter sp.]|uniref:YHS domain-containing (seleno)protein n=1 Tax=Erythrobacter sp. TaxID=1042 RepID=UPI00262CC893|nr:YHS domain-containing (seleno)protein [Erythrobacter sp.]MDJ0977487.1 YHS domain-containing (seleno)protein [Erythrobacter sp.]